METSLFNRVQATLLALATASLLVLAVFNLMPFPPLDGSHLFRHMISGKFATMYDNLGWMGFILAFIVGGWVTMRIVSPILAIFLTLLLHA